MADKTYACIAGLTVRDTFDNKYKSSLPGMMKAAGEKAVNASSLLTTKRPVDKNAKGFSLGGGLSLKKTAKGAEAKVEILLYYWPKDAMFANVKGSGSVETGGSDIDGAVEDLVQQVVEDAVKKKAVPELEKRVRNGDLG